jgi:hypothetical protein
LIFTERLGQRKGPKNIIVKVLIETSDGKSEYSVSACSQDSGSAIDTAVKETDRSTHRTGGIICC